MLVGVRVSACSCVWVRVGGRWWRLVVAGKGWWISVGLDGFWYVLVGFDWIWLGLSVCARFGSLSGCCGIWVGVGGL